MKQTLSSFDWSMGQRGCLIALFSLFCLALIGCEAETETASEDTASASTPAAGDAGAETAQDTGGTTGDTAAEVEEWVPVGDPCLNPGTDGATATCLAPTQTPEHYISQAEKYFDTLDITADPESVPDYSLLVARWEWPPWLLLTAFGRQDMIDTNVSLKVLDPSTVPERDCRAFAEQPFARCRIVFEYEGKPCPIYEEFTFNDAGEVTFIEAWSDLPSLRPPLEGDNWWGERGAIGRLSTRVPGLGKPDGLIDLESQWMLDAARLDPDVADFAMRAADWWKFWYDLLFSSPDGFFDRGCGW